MICIECGAENRPGDRFCEQCGSPLSDGAEVGVSSARETLIAAPSGDGSLVRLGAEGGQSYQLGSRATVGRLDSADVPVNDKSVSREHARISRLQGTYVVEDLRSTNGTLVNGQRIEEPTVLRPGDIVTFGAIEFRFEVESPDTLPQAAGASPVIGRFAGATAEDRPPEVDSSPLSFPPVDAFGPEDTASQERRPVPPASAPEPPAFAAEAEQPPFGGQQDSHPFAAEPEPASWAPPPAAEPEPPSWAPPPAAEPPPWSAQPAREPASAAPPPPAPPRPQPAPESRETTSGESPAGEAMETLQRLSTLVEDMARRLQSAEADQERLRDAQSALEDANRRHDAIRQAVRNAQTGGMQPQQLGHLLETLDALVQNPRDIDLLRTVSQDAPNISAALKQYAQMRLALDNVVQAAGDSR